VRSYPCEREFVVKQKVAAGSCVTQAHSAFEHPFRDSVKSYHRLVLRRVGLPKTRSRKILRRFLKAKEAGLDAGDVCTMEG
jgi:acyl-coenzyme A synthetase/AMP-(fatty) acid ligase